MVIVTIILINLFHEISFEPISLKKKNQIILRLFRIKWS